MQHIRRLIQAITIDGPGARDLDDAFMVKRAPSGPWLVDVSIADVASFVLPHTPADRQALRRGFSLYAGHTLKQTMLPHDVSHDLASLLSGRPRPAITLRMRLDAQSLDITWIAAERTLVDNIAQLDHADASRILGDERHILNPALKAASDLAHALFQKRRARGGIALWDPAAGVMTAEDGTLVRFADEGEGAARLIVQELMILANRGAAHVMHGNGVPILYRAHALRPGERDLDVIAEIRRAAESGDAARLGELRAKAPALFERARYSVEPDVHVTLGLPRYATFTSPIRRYADLVNHRMLAALIERAPAPYGKPELIRIAAHLTALESDLQRAREDAFREKMRQRAGELLRARRFNGLDAHDFGHVLRAAANQQDFPAELQVELERRLGADDFSPRDAARVLLNDKTPMPAAAKLAVAQWALRRPHLAASIWNVAQQGRGFPPLAFDVSEGGPRFAPVHTAQASIDLDGRRHVSAAAARSSRRAAEQAAAADLLAKVAGFSLPLPEEEAAAPAESDNPKGRLFEWCQKRRLPLPTFDIQASGPAHAQVFSATASVILDGNVQVSPPARATSRKAAEKNAAKALLEILPQDEAPATAPAVPPAAGEPEQEELQALAATP